MSKLSVPKDTEQVKAGQIIRPVFVTKLDMFVLAAFSRSGKPHLLPTLTLDWLYEPDATKAALLSKGAVVSSSCMEMCHV